MTNRNFIYVCSGLMMAGLLTSPLLAAETATEAGFISLFDGKSMTGWRPSEENPESWKVKDGTLMCDGPRCHLFYVGDQTPFKNFHLKAEVMTTPGSNAGIYFHTRFQNQVGPNMGLNVRSTSAMEIQKRPVAYTASRMWLIRESVTTNGTPRKLSSKATW